MPEGVLTLFTVLTHIATFATSKSRLRREYLIPTDNVIVFDHICNFTKNYNLISRL